MYFLHCKICGDRAAYDKESNIIESQKNKEAYRLKRFLIENTQLAYNFYAELSYYKKYKENPSSLSHAIECMKDIITLYKKRDYFAKKYSDIDKKYFHGTKTLDINDWNKTDVFLINDLSFNGRTIRLYFDIKTMAIFDIIPSCFTASFAPDGLFNTMNTIRQYHGAKPIIIEQEEIHSCLFSIIKRIDTVCKTNRGLIMTDDILHTINTMDFYEKHRYEDIPDNVKKYAMNPLSRIANINKNAIQKRNMEIYAHMNRKIA